MPPPSDRAVGDVLTDVAHNVERLVRAHVHLEAAGVVEAVAEMARGIGLVVAGAVLAMLTTLLLLLGAAVRLSDMMRPWEAVLLVAAGAGLLSVVAGAAGVRALRGRCLTGPLDTARLENDAWPTQPLT
jgi:hypothetical protein